MKQLEEQDASYLYLETPETPMHVGGLNLVELPEGYAGDFYEDYKAHIASRLHLVPMLTRKLLQLPFDIDHPLWLDEPNIDIDYHIRHVTLPRPGTMRQLEELVARLHSSFLDRSRPLWEFYVIDGLASGQIAIYSKEHHAAMDGASSQLLANAVYDVTPVPRHVPPPAKRALDVDPGTLDVVGAVVKHFMRQEIRTVQFIPELIKAWTNLVLPNVDTLKLDSSSMRLPPRSPHTLLNVDITSQRAYAARTLPLTDIKWVAKHANVKVNDVVLAICATVLRNYLTTKGDLPNLPLTAMVPVSLHDANETETKNQNSMMICNLATNISSPLERLHAIADASRQQKQLIKKVKNILIPEISFIGSGILLRGMMELYRRSNLAERIPPLANLPISNVQGPPMPLYVAGAKVKTFYPVSIPAHGNALNITVQSYCNALDLGLTACRRTVPDITALADAFAPALEELKAAVAAQLPQTPAVALPAAKPAPAPAALAAPAASKAEPKAEPKTKASAKAKPVAKAKPASATETKPAAKPTAKAAAPKAVAAKTTAKKPAAPKPATAKAPVRKPVTKPAATAAAKTAAPAPLSLAALAAAPVSPPAPATAKPRAASKKAKAA